MSRPYPQLSPQALAQGEATAGSGGSGATTFVAEKLLHVRDQKTAGTDGGGSTAATWNTRTLNTEVTNEITGASLATNQITLPAGTYYIEASAPCFQGDANKIKLRNTTDASDTLIGASCHARSGASGDGTHAFLKGRFTIAAQKTFELQHYVTTTKATNGFGINTNAAVVEVYAEVRIWTVEDQAAEIVTGTLQVQDQKAANTTGGGFTSGSWQTRTLNTEATNTIAGSSLASNQITLPAGTYEIDASAPAYQVNRHKAKLRDTTGAADLVIGTSEFARVQAADANETNRSLVKGRFTLSTTSVLELQHRCETTNGTNGSGVESNFGVTEIYADVTIRKIST